MKDEVREYLEDILKEAGDIRDFTEGKGLEQYSKDRLLKAGIESKVKIIGEVWNWNKSDDGSIFEEVSY